MLQLSEGGPKWYLFNVSFLCIGIGYLFPFSALTQPVDFWKYLYPDRNLNFSIAAYYNYTNLIVLALIVWLKPQGSVVFRITSGFLGQIVALIVIPTLWFFTSNETYYYCIMFGTCFLAIVTALLDCSVISLGARFPNRMQESLQLGIGVSTLIGSFYRLVTKGLFPVDWIVYSSVAYFYTGALTIMICLVAFYYLVRESGLNKKSRGNQDPEQVEDDDASTESSAPTYESVINESEPLIEGVQETAEPLKKLPIIRKIIWNETLVVVMFCITLAVWPAIISELPQFGNISDISDQWWPLILLTFFSFSDVMGRFAVSYLKIPGLNHKTVIFPILLRLAFVPLIAWQCSPSKIFGPLPLVFSNDFWTLFLVFFFGFSNGYVGTISIVSVNECCQSGPEKSYAGTLTSFFLNFGLVLGASMGLVFEKFVLSKNSQ